MALQIWLPLDGDLRNNGLDPGTFINTNAVISNSGKIGKCYTFTKNASIRYNGNFNISNSLFSVCFWMRLTAKPANPAYLISLNATGGMNDTTIGGYVGTDGTIHIGCNGVDKTCALGAHGYALNTWTHVCWTMNNGQVIGYVNGESLGTATASTLLIRTKLAIGARHTAAETCDYGFENGGLNDFRIYNHCLSIKEIKEIMKGLILHYPMNLADDKIMQGHNLPSEYQEVEYLESSGTQWINTGIKINCLRGTGRIKFCFTNLDGGNGGIFGARETNGSSADGTACCLFYNVAANKIRYDWYDYNVQQTVQIFEDYDISFSNYKVVNNHKTIMSSSSITYLDRLHTYAMYLFTFCDAGGGRSNKSSIRLYNAELSIDGTKIDGDFIPCYRKSDNKPGVYNLITNQFLTNAGTGEFICGPLIKQMPSEYGLLNYIESTGTQYINTGFNPTGNTRVIMDCLNTQYNSPSAIFGARSGATSLNFNLWLQSDLFGAQYYNNVWNSNQKTLNLANNFLHIDYNKNNCTINKVTATFTKQTFNTPYPLYLLSLNSGGAVDNRMAYAKLYKCQIWNNDILQRDFRPVLRLSDNKPGMYDLVNDIFYVNAGSGEFTYSSSIDDIAYDTSGYCINSNIDGNIITTKTTPRYNSAFIFNGLTCIKNSNYNLGNIWSVSFWAKINNTNTSGWQAFYALNTAGGDTDLATNIYLNAGNLSCQFTANGQYQVVSSIGINRTDWFHYCITFDGSTVKGYINGTQKMSKAITNAQLIRHNLVIGAKSNSSDASTVGGYFKGVMSDFRIYATALSATDVTELYETSMIVDASGNITPRVLT